MTLITVTALLPALANSAAPYLTPRMIPPIAITPPAAVPIMAPVLKELFCVFEPKDLLTKEGKSNY